MRFPQILIGSTLALLVLCAPSATIAVEAPPAVPREFRAAWVATVHNINWPSRRGLSSAAQQAELISLLDQAHQLGLNAIVFQVRPACDALYQSKIEPWSPYLSGTMGKPPSPFYDPLEVIVREAHARGLELHAWFNPFRALANAKEPTSRSHVTRTHGSALRGGGSSIWLDPGLAFSQQRAVEVIKDVVTRYDVDGIHLDDYFYPYPADPSKGAYPFDDGKTYAAYKERGGALERDDWRRANIDALIQVLYSTVKTEKAWVKFGISPFGIWRPGYPSSITAGLDAYGQIYADSRKWLNEGWCDYLSPQLYWRIDDRPHSFSTLFRWWDSESKHGRHVWPGIASDRIGSKDKRTAKESLLQVEIARSGMNSRGHIHWSIAPLLENRQGVGKLLKESVYQEPALVPASPWLSKSKPATPRATLVSDEDGEKVMLRFAPAVGDSDPTLAWWAVQQLREGDWKTTAILPATAKNFPLDGAAPEAFAVTAVDRYGNESEPEVVQAEE